ITTSSRLKSRIMSGAAALWSRLSSPPSLPQLPMKLPRRTSKTSKKNLLEHEKEDDINESRNEDSID
ncbi:unnamed protein product, partial [Amoebophrya sp. A25]